MPTASRLRSLYRALLAAWLVAAVAACAACAPTPSPHTSPVPYSPPRVRRTLAHDGGLRLSLRAACSGTAPSCDLAATLPATLAMLRLRATDGLGVADAVVGSQDARDVVVELPADRDTSHAVEALTTPGYVAFLGTGHTALPLGANVSARTCAAQCAPGQYAAVFTGQQVDPASVTAHVDTVTGLGYVVLAFAGDTQTAFANYTHTHLGKYLTATRDGIVIESAQIADIVPGPTEITGLPSEQEARLLAAYLKGGPLPLTLTVADETLVSPSP
jgi:preprotein translocase subunit SecD